ncbi:MAG: N-acetylmuramoyl-L-alanine amidase [Elusimicrobia bacterium]|nr:N-acetylmuramoyl-L-alanine amidase [Elusimicrobiota bacterium]
MIASLLAVCVLGLPAWAAPDPIVVRYPEEGATLPALTATYVMGAVIDADAPFSINGRPVKPHRTGGFLAYVPVSTGSFSLACELALAGGTKTLVRTVLVLGPPAGLPPGPAAIEASGVEPSSDVGLEPGDWLSVGLRGTPGHRAEFQTAGRRRKLPMAETAPGVYQGAARVEAEDFPEPAPVRFQLTDAGGRRAGASSSGKVAVIAGTPAVVAVRSDEPVNVRSGPGTGYLMFPPVGTRFLASGRVGKAVRLELPAGAEGWIDQGQVEVLPAGTPPPLARLHFARTAAGKDASFVLLGLTEKVPFLIAPGEDLGSVVVRLFYAEAGTDWVVYDSSDAFVREVSWKSPAGQTVEVTVALASPGRLWGYGASWEEGALRIELRHPPRMTRPGLRPGRGAPAGLHAGASVFAGRVVVLDPGHGPSAPGAIGPTGVREVDVNFAVAMQLESMLEREGASVRLTRSRDSDASLSERARVARESRPDLFVSIHNNNLNEAANPFAYPHGYSVFYYHPHSMDLARHVHRSFQRSIGLQDERLRFGDLFMARVSEMPAVLVEGAYMTYPEQEELLNTPAFQRRMAAAVLEGMRGFLRGSPR